MQTKTTLTESTPASDKAKLFQGSSERGAFSRDLMRQAIEQGAEVGLLFQSNNSRYKMPVSKYRIIQPVAVGTNANGQVVVRGIHVFGQSERAAQETGVRSAEIENEWRLFNASNIKGMWLTGRYYSDPIPNVSASDKGMASIDVVYSPSRAAAYQATIAEPEPEVEPEPEASIQERKLPPKERRKWVRSLFASTPK
jgi:hypothetical protein